MGRCFLLYCVPVITHYHRTEICLHVICQSQHIDARTSYQGFLMMVCGAWVLGYVCTAFVLLSAYELLVTAYKKFVFLFQLGFSVSSIK